MRLHFIVEGQTEETFVNNTLAPHLAGMNVIADARRVMTSKTKAKIYRGGVTNYHKAQFDITQWCKQDIHGDSRFTTMFDYYALPGDFPGYEEAQKLSDVYERIRTIEQALREDIGDYRFIPYIQLHEFEALLFADTQKLEWAFIDHDKQIEGLVKFALLHESPELTNHKPDTAPSKRIIAAIPEYGPRKASAGPLVADKIGISTMRAKCKHFNDWITTLESLDSQVKEE